MYVLWHLTVGVGTKLWLHIIFASLFAFRTKQQKKIICVLSPAGELLAFNNKQHNTRAHSSDYKAYTH